MFLCVPFSFSFVFFFYVHRTIQETLHRCRTEHETERIHLESEANNARDELMVMRSTTQESQAATDKLLREKQRDLTNAIEENKEVLRALNEEKEKNHRTMDNLNRTNLEQQKRMARMEEESKTIKMEVRSTKSSHVEHVETIRRQHATASEAMEQEIDRLNLSVDRLKKEMTACSEQIRNEQARVRQLQSANACHVRSSEQLEEDLENMRIHVASENAAGERWSVLVSGVWGRAVLSIVTVCCF